MKRRDESGVGRKRGGSSITALSTVAPDRRCSYDVSPSIRAAFTNPGLCCPNEWPVPRTPSSSSKTAPAEPQRRSLSSWISSDPPADPFLTSTGKPTNPQSGSPLFARLPLEIRRQVYSHLLHQPSPILCVDRGGLPRTAYALAPAILRSCRLVLAEALPVLYSQNRFTINHIPNLLRSSNSAPRFAICPRYFALIRYLNVDVPDKYIPRFYATDWGDEYEGFVDCVSGVIRAAGRGLRHVQLRLVRNCALESYTSWGPYLQPGAPIMAAVADAHCPTDGGSAKDEDGYARKLHLLVPCQGCEGPELCFDVWRPDAPVVVHCIARSLGALQRTAGLNGWPLEDVLKVKVATRDKRDGDIDAEIAGFDAGQADPKAEIVVDREREEIILEIDL
ncbi:hypothetical protein K490DRAFT_59782 [Saccharata proteae CBS 121410]|uniref:F-box domain-containing protein n=1 Tax=Saccharata proteae CBS 121410 TaxID=1314787 RepID=A0A9P4HRW4_9PEZI|nr:hypothetical protein K490DRAFT_59782 [Saccharata proteae CBS 121410]